MVRKEFTGILALVMTFCLCAEASTAGVHQEGSRWSIANESLERVVETEPFLRTVSITNRLTESAHRYAIESRGFELWLDDDKLRLSSDDFQVGIPEVHQNGDIAQLVVPLKSEEHGIQVRVTYSLAKNAFYTRKQLAIDPGEHLLNKVDVESFRLEGVAPQRFDEESMPFPMVPWDIMVGRPIFGGREFFFGVEHPASYNVSDDEQWITLRHHPGRKGKVTSWPAVIGVCPDRPRERLLDYFHRYVDENRARPVKRTIQWIEYFEAKMADDQCREKIAVAEKVFRDHNAPLDVVAMDSGWTDPQSIMRMSPKYPDRLALMAKLAKERLGAELGLHAITSGVKPMVDKDWLAAQGYDMIYHKSKSDGAYCMADPRVFAEFRDNLVRYVRDYKIASYKFDWGRFSCGEANHRGHLPGKEYGFEAGAENYRQIHQALREVNPDIFLFNTGWYSPWWLWTYDAMFTAGADYNFDLTGPPSFSTASLLCTWRDATIRGNIVGWSPFFPINSLMCHDPLSYWWQEWSVRSESELRPFTDYLVTAWLRGSQMAEIGSNIPGWSDAHADTAASILKWMKANDDVILESSRYIGGDPLSGEPYGYAHFTKANRGIIVVRNPTIEPRTLKILLNEQAGMWPNDRESSDKEYVVRIVYPQTEVLSRTFRYGDTCEQKLASHEVRVLEVWPIDALSEPMPIGCRYQVASREPGQTTIRLASLPEKLEVFSPVAPKGASPVAGKSHRYVMLLPEGSGDKASGKTYAKLLPVSLDRLILENGTYVLPIEIPEQMRARVAFLFRQNGLQGQMTLDGEKIEPDAPHLFLSDAKDRAEAVPNSRGDRARAGNWSMFGVELGPGTHALRFEPATKVKQDGLLIVDVRKTISAEHVLEINHKSIDREDMLTLPQNWAWQLRRVNSFPLPTP